jgi:uracil-DNA glycosylase family 4
VLASGPPNPIGVCVAQSPGAEEAKQGTPLVGPTGEWFDEELTQAGLPRARLQLINAIACLPSLGAGENDMRRAAQACKPVFDAQLVKGVPTLAMGKWAHYALTGRDKGVLKIRGFVDYERKQITTWHPTYAAWHNPYEWGAFTVDLQRFARLIRGKLRPRPHSLLTNPTRADVDRLVADAKGKVSLDIETRPESAAEPWTGKDPTRARIKVIGLGCADWALSCWWTGKPRGAMRRIIEVIEDESILKITQNGHFFDLPILRRYGINAR